MKRTYVMPLLVLTLICLVVSGALAFMNSLTSPIIAASAEENAQTAMKEKIPNATGFELLELANYEGIPSTIRQIYKTTNNVGYIFIAAINGYSGEITIMCAVDPEGKIIDSGVLSHTETQGIGTIIEKESFLDPFRGMSDTVDGIDTVAGATISTRAYIRAIEDVLAAFEIVRE